MKQRGTLGTTYTMLCMDTQYNTYFTERTKPGCLSSRPSIVLSGKPGDEATRAIAGAQAEVAGACAPVCPSLATPLLHGAF